MYFMWKEIKLPVTRNKRCAMSTLLTQKNSQEELWTNIQTHDVISNNQQQTIIWVQAVWQSD